MRVSEKIPSWKLYDGAGQKNGDTGRTKLRSGSESF
jgi:hypothetical protein